MESALIYCKEDEKYSIKPNGFSARNEYLFMEQEYFKSDFRYNFIQFFQRLVSEKLNWNICSCKIFYLPIANLANVLNVYIYSEDASLKGTITQQSEGDKNHPVFVCFYEAAGEYPLPAAQQHLIRIVIEDAKSIRLSYFMQMRYADIKKAVLEKFPIVEDANFFSPSFCLILKKKCDLQRLYREGILEEMRKTCYSALIRSASEQKEMPYDAFHIRADNSGVYQEKGSRYFWDSEEYTNSFII